MPLRPAAEAYHHDGGPVGVLLLHGFTGSPAALRPWAEHLAGRGLTVRLPLLPGHGTSWQDLNTTTWAQWLDTAELALRDLAARCPRVVLAGLSMGGALAIRLAEWHGPHIDGLIVVNPALRVRDPRLAALPLLKRVVGSLPGVGDDISRAGVSEGAYDRMPLRALHSQVRGWRTVVRDLDRVTQPLLVLRSATDHVVPAESSALLIARTASTDITEIVLERSFHVATLDHDAPRLMAEADRFLDRVTR